MCNGEAHDASVFFITNIPVTPRGRLSHIRTTNLHGKQRVTPTLVMRWMGGAAESGVVAKVEDLASIVDRSCFRKANKLKLSFDCKPNEVGSRCSCNQLVSDDAGSVTPEDHQNSQHGRNQSAAALPSVNSQESNDNALKSAEPETLCCLHWCNVEEMVGLAGTVGDRRSLSNSTDAATHD